MPNENNNAESAFSVTPGSAPSLERINSRVIQIQVIMHPGDYNTGVHVQMHALCEDGTWWVRYESSGASNVPTDNRWYFVN